MIKIKSQKALLLILIVFSTWFFSCNGLFESVSDDDSDSSDASLISVQNTRGVFFGKVENALSSSSSRTIMPSFSITGLTYKIYATGGSEAIEANVKDGGNYTITISNDGTYVVTAEISDSNGNILYKGQSSSLKITNGLIDGTKNEIDTIKALPVQSSSGEGNAAITIDVSGTKINKIVASWKKSGGSAITFTKELGSASSFDLYLSNSTNEKKSISAGCYYLSLSFYADSIRIYDYPDEIVQIYDNIETTGKISVNSAAISATAYVSSSASDGGKGTYYSPFSSISSALEKVKASGESEMTIYIDGTFSLSSAIEFSDSKTWNIYGLNGAENSVITNSSGIGISVASGSTVNLKNIKVSGCSSSGIKNKGTLTLESCVISGNGNSSSDGGGIYNSGALTVTSSTISGNTAESGGGIYKSNSGAITIEDSEITGNKASSGGGIGVYTVLVTSGDISIGGKVNISGNTLLDGTTANNALTTSDFKLAVSSALSSESKIGISLSSTLSLGKTRTITSGYKTNNSSTEASKIFFSDNDSYSILTNSDGEVIVSNTVSETSLYVSSSGSDSNKGTKDAPLATIQYAVDAFSAVNDGTTEYTIYLLSDITAKNYKDGQTSFIDISPSSALKLTIEPSGISEATINAKNNLASTSYRYRVMNVGENATVTLENLTLADGYVKGSGGGIYNEGTLTLKNCTISDSTATASAGGIYTSGILYMEGGEISGNTAAANNGGGLQSYASSGKVFLKNVSIKNNTATKGNGGGIAISSAKYLALEGCTITGNKATAGSGGGIYIAGGLSLFGAIDVSSNTAASYGANICWANDSNSKTIAIGTDSTTSLTLGEQTVTPAALSVASGKSICATIMPASDSNSTSTSYIEGTALLKSASSSGSLSDFVDLFTIDDDDTTDSYTWYIDDDGKLQKNGGTVYSSWSALSTAVSDGLSSSETSLSYRIADISDFNNSTIALSGSSKKVSIVPTCDLTITGSSISSAFFTVSDLTATIGNGNYSTTIGDSSVAASLNFIYMIDANLSLKKCVFQNSTANAAINSSGTLSLKNCTFKNITPSETLGTVYVQNGTATVDSCTFTNCENSDIRTKSSGKLVLQGTLSDTNIYIENSTTAGVVTLDTSLSLASGAGVTFTIGSYDSSVKVFASSDGGEISESIRNNSDIMITDAAGNDYTINADGTLTKKDDSALSSLYTDPKEVSGVPTAGKTYKVSSENDLIYLNALVDAGNKLAGVTLQQTKDIALSDSWNPIGSQLNAFMGTYDGKDSDGNSHSVTNLSYSGSENCVGFFAYVSGATIQNLTVSGSISTTGQWAGGIAGYIDGSTTNTFDNCVNNASITSSKGYAGGIAGAYKVSSGSITIKNCYNTGNISCDGTSSALGYGGIIGYTGSSGTVTVKNCVNTGSVGGNYATGAGGIIGNGDGNRSLENCASTGTITHLSSDNNHGAIAGSYNSALKLTHTYYKEGADSYGRAYLASSTSPTADASGEVISFSSTGALTKSETVSSTSYSDVVSALNAWVNANGSDSYRTWTSSDLGL